jgi:hypothetical protein
MGSLSSKASTENRQDGVTDSIVLMVGLRGQLYVCAVKVDTSLTHNSLPGAN